MCKHSPFFQEKNKVKNNKSYRGVVDVRPGNLLATECQIVLEGVTIEQDHLANNRTSVVSCCSKGIFNVLRSWQFLFTGTVVNEIGWERIIPRPFRRVLPPGGETAWTAYWYTTVRLGMICYHSVTPSYLNFILFNKFKTFSLYLCICASNDDFSRYFSWLSRLHYLWFERHN